DPSSFNFMIGFFGDYILIKNQNNPDDFFVKIDSNGNVVSIDGSKVSAKPLKTVYGQAIMGIIKLNTGYHVVIINGCETVGVINTATILKAKDTCILRIDQSPISDQKEKVLQDKYLANLKSALSVKSFYFSNEYDVTNSLQNQFSLDKNKSAWENANQEFFYNHYLSEPLIAAATSDNKIGSIICPVISGFIEVIPVILKDQPISISLITRRSRHKQGTRYFSRGANDDGFVSNFAETEQIVEISGTGNPDFAEYHGTLMSLVQIRGSIPIRWAQVITGKYKPRIEIDIRASEPGFKKHMQTITKSYNKVIMVNLADKVKYEKPVCDAFGEMVSKFSDKNSIEYIHFDFHKECSRMRFDRVSLLIDQIKTRLDEFGSFIISPKKSAEPTRIQTGVVRSNCMDCLDRTNVMQSVLSDGWLIQEFRKMKFLGENETFDKYDQISASLRNIWADNADYVSLAYSGTGALKTDFTRTGKRTTTGLLMDGVNSIERYIKNNFLDGYRQDSYDLFLGYYRIGEDTGAQSMTRPLSSDAKAVLGSVLLSIFMFFFTLLRISSNGASYFSTILPLLVWPSAAYFGTLALFKRHSEQILNWPSFVAYPYQPQPVLINEKIKIPVVSDFIDSKVDNLFKKKNVKTE
ncbi:hypothetical protein BB560_001477, partial [Smittium megazygosporum]